MKAERILTDKKTVVVLAVLTCLLWGSAFPMIKLGYATYEISSNDIASQILFAGTRFTFSGILIILIGSFMLKRLPKVELKHVPKIFKLSLFQTIGQYVFFYMGLANATGTNSSIIDGSAALITVLFAGFYFKEDKIDLNKLIGCILGFSGIVLVAVSGGNNEFGFSVAGEGMLIIATFACGFASILIKKYSEDVNPVFLCGYQFVFGGILMALGAYSFGGRIYGINGANVIILIYLAMLSMVAYTTWSILLKYNSAAKVGIFGVLVPIFGVILSAIVLKENPTNSYTLISLILVCLGIVLVNRNKKSKKKSEIVEDNPA